MWVRPTGTVSFLFTDVERSTQQWDEQPVPMAAAIARHDEIVRAVVTAHRGYVFSTSGDGFAVAFWTPHEAVAAANEIQTRLADEPWPPPVRLAMRMGIHTGTADERNGDYFGPTLNRAARLMGAGHGGQILLSGITAQLIGSSGLVDLGEQRLKDLATPERVFQVGDDTFPPLLASSAMTVRLPEWGTRFVGRSSELALLTGRVRARRVVVLVGPGGVGKTRLAAEVAQQLVEEFRAGIFFVGLAGIVADTVDYAIADSVGVQREPHRSPLDSLVAWLGQRSVLLVLDNCEEVVTTARRTVDVLVQHCPGVRVLVTSRVPLGTTGEVRVPLRPLDGAAAFDLLVDRLAEMSQDFDAGRDADAVQALCRRLDGMPLALELAAARCRTLTPAELIVRLERRPDVLSDTAGLFDERHRDLDQLIEWSLRELNPLARRVLGRLTVVIGSFTIDAAEAIARSGDIDDVDIDLALEELEDAGLIVREQTPVGVRHRILEPIRQHITAITDLAEITSSADRYTNWFCELARAVKTGGVGPDFGRWADIVEFDMSNFRQAHRLLIERGDQIGAVTIIDGLCVVGIERGLMELADWCDTTVELVNGRHDHLELAALATAAQFWQLQNRVEEIPPAAERMSLVDGSAEHHLALELVAVRATLSPKGWADAVVRLQRALARYGHSEPTWATGQVVVFLVLLGGLDESAAAPIANQLDSPVLSATFAFYRAVPYYVRDEDEIGSELAGEAVAMARTAGATLQTASALMGQGGWRARVSRFADAEIFEPLVESLDLWERLRIPWGRIAIIEEIAQSLAIRGRPIEATVLWGAVDATGIEAPAKAGRHRRTASHISAISPAQAKDLRTRGAAMTLDGAIAYARTLSSPTTR